MSTCAVPDVAQSDESLGVLDSLIEASFSGAEGLGTTGCTVQVVAVAVTSMAVVKMAKSRPLRGLARVNYLDVIGGKQHVGKKVAIIGAGGIGFDTAEYITHAGESTSQNIPAFMKEWGVDMQIARFTFKTHLQIAVQISSLST